MATLIGGFLQCWVSPTNPWGFSYLKMISTWDVKWGKPTIKGNHPYVYCRNQGNERHIIYGGAEERPEISRSRPGHLRSYGLTYIYRGSLENFDPPTQTKYSHRCQAMLVNPKVDMEAPFVVSTICDYHTYVFSEHQPHTPKRSQKKRC